METIFQLLYSQKNFNILQLFLWVYLSRMDLPTLINRMSQFPILGVLLVFFFFFLQILKEHSISKQCRSWSVTAYCGVWSGSALFAFVPYKVRSADLG